MIPKELEPYFDYHADSLHIHGSWGGYFISNINAQRVASSINKHYLDFLVSGELTWKHVSDFAAPYNPAPLYLLDDLSHKISYKVIV